MPPFRLSSLLTVVAALSAVAPSPSERKAVVEVRTGIGPSARRCTGVWVGRGKVLTAAHCVARSDLSAVAIRQGAGDPTLAVTNVRTSPAGEDLALLDTDAEGPGGVPLPVTPDRSNTRDVSHADLAAVLLRDGSLKTRIVRLKRSRQVLDWPSGAAVLVSDAPFACPGDSGAPVFGGQRDGAVLLGVVVDAYGVACGARPWWRPESSESRLNVVQLMTARTTAWIALSSLRSASARLATRPR